MSATCPTTNVRSPVAVITSVLLVTYVAISHVTPKSAAKKKMPPTMGNTARLKGDLDQRAMPQVLPMWLGGAYFSG